MTVEYRTGDLFEQDDLEAIGHGVNVFGVMGGGIARVFRDKFPIMHTQYKLMCELGLIEPGDVWPWIEREKNYYIFNIASQDAPGPHARLQWLSQGLIKAMVMCEALNIPKLGVPRIGAGIGGLQWEDVKSLYEHLDKLVDLVDLVVVSLPEATP